MKPDTVHQTLFGTAWKRCRLTLSSGEVLVIKHPDWVFMAPTRTFLIVVLADDSYRVIEPDHIVTLDVERLSGGASKAKRAA